uniref:Alanine--glyoxylate aminotransferase 2, mitochondrial n=1 Tax=Maylandia zebra TaxID=106582 RepID=A0A3P9CX10_9CICH
HRVLQKPKSLCSSLFFMHFDPVFIHQGYMQWLWDVDGKQYLDLFTGVATVSVGHCHPKVTTAIQKQLKKLWHTTNIYIHPELHEYCDKLAPYLPDPLKVLNGRGWGVLTSRRHLKHSSQSPTQH